MNPAPAELRPPYDSAAKQQLVRRVFTVLRAHPRLVLFPLASFLVMLLTVAGLCVLWGRGTHLYPKLPRYVAAFAALFHRNGSWQEVLRYASVYLSITYGAIFLNVAAYHEILETLAGEPPSFRRGLRFALSRAWSILTWSLFAASVGFLIQAFNRRLGWFGKLAGLFGGFAWSVATIFAIPILVREGVGNPVQLVRLSSGLVRRNWGDLIYGLVRIWGTPVAIMLFVLFVPDCVVIPMVLSHRVSGFVYAILGCQMGAVLVICSLSALVSQIYGSALYIFATEGVVPGPFLRADMDAYWKVKGR